MTKHVHQKAEFADILSQSAAERSLVIIKFGANWCGPCKAIAPHFDAWAKKYENLAHFLSINVDDLPEVAETFKVTSIPAFVIVENLQQIDSWTGANTTIVDQHLVKALQRNVSGQTSTGGASYDAIK